MEARAAGLAPVRYRALELAPAAGSEPPTSALANTLALLPVKA